MARPKKTTDDLPKDWKQGILDIYINGGCDVEVRAFLGGIDHDGFYRLMGNEPELNESIKKGRVFAEAWWMKQGRKNLRAGLVNTGLYALQMRNRFGWRDANRPEGDIGNVSDKLKEIASTLEGLDGKTDTI